MSEPNYELTYLDEIHVTLAANTALSDATKLDGLKTFTHKITTKFQELELLNTSDNWTRQVPTGRSGDGTLAGFVVKDSTVQATLTTAVDTMVPIYVTCITNKTAAVGTKKGTQYCYFIESSERPREGNGIVTFNYPLKQHGPPVAILAT